MNRASYELIVNTLGVPAQVTHAKTEVTKSVPHVGIANARTVGDTDVVNAYGINARIVTILSSSVPFEVEKFDTVMIAGEKLVLEAVISVHEAGTGTVIGYRGFVRGK